MDHHCFSRAGSDLATISSKSPTSYQNLNTLNYAYIFANWKYFCQSALIEDCLTKALAVHLGRAFKHCIKSMLDKRKMI